MGVTCMRGRKGYKRTAVKQSPCGCDLYERQERVKHNAETLIVIHWSSNGQ